MSDITSEGSAGWDTAKAVGGKIGDYLKQFDPTQKFRKSPTILSPKAQKSADTVAAKNAETAKLREPAQARISDTTDELARVQAKDTHAIIPKDSKIPVPKAEYEKQLQNKLAADKKIVQANPKLPDVAKDAYSAKRHIPTALLATGLVDRGVKAATASTDDPEGYSLVRGLSSLASGAISGASEIPGDVTTGISNPAFQRPEPGASARDPSDSDVPKLDESAIDILKLAGVKSITQRDNISGMTKVKEIKQLNESTDLNECGMGMPSSNNTTASLSINATAGSGEEVANMLKSLMDLAGVKPVTGDMLGSEMTPMPMVKAIDIISRPHDHEEHDHDSMEPQDDKMNKEPLTGSMEETYANTPEDPTDIPKYDPEKMVFRPNQPQQGDRMDGTMPKGNPGMSEAADLTQTLLKEYEAFKNGQ